MSNPTPTTLREILSDPNYFLVTERGNTVFNPDQATQSIKEQLKALLPRKKSTGGLNAYDPEDIKEKIEIHASNKTINQIEKAIEEWAK